MKKVRIKLCLLPKISGVEVAPCLLPKISGVEVTPSVTSVESSEQFWHKIRQIWRICEPWFSQPILLGLVKSCILPSGISEIRVLFPASLNINFFKCFLKQVHQEQRITSAVVQRKSVLQLATWASCS